MGFFWFLFARRKNSVRVDIAGSRLEVIAAAEHKLGRRLSMIERQGIESITSLMMLESCYRSFSSPTCTTAEVIADLEHFAKAAEAHSNS